MKIEASNLRSIGIPFAIDINGKKVLQGKNGVGKSTMAKVPYYVMTGKGLTIKNNETECYGKIEFAGMSIVREKKNGNTTIRVNGKACSEIAMREHLNMKGFNPDVLITLFNTETVLDGETMLKVAAMKLDVDKVLSFTTLDDDCKKIVKRYFDEKNIDIVTIPIINRAHQSFYSMRTENNRIVKNLKTLIADKPYDMNTQIPDIKVYVDLNEQLNKERNEIVKEIALINSVVEKQNYLTNQVTKLLSKKAKIEEENKEDVEKIAELMIELSEQIAKETVNKENLEKEMLRLNNQILDYMELISDKKSECGIIAEKQKAQIKTLETLKNTSSCPLYAGLTCTTNMSKVCEAIEEELKKLESEKENKNSEITKMSDELDKIKKDYEITQNSVDVSSKKIAQLNNELQLAKNKKDKATMMLSQMSEINIEIAQHEVELKALVIKDATTEKERLSNIETKIAETNNKIANISNIIKEITEYKNRCDDLEKAEQISARYTTIIQELQKLPNNIFEKIIAPIESSLNQILKDLKDDWNVKFDFSGKELSINIITPNGIIDIEELSTGERIIINYVFKALICQMIDFDTIILDNTDALDEKNYNAIEEVVEKSQYNTMLITCANYNSKFAIHKM